MTLKQAQTILETAPTGEAPSRLNPSLTQAQAVQIVRNALATMGRPKDNPCGLDDQIDPLMEKRVHQVTRNQRRPRYA